MKTGRGVRSTPVNQPPRNGGHLKNITKQKKPQNNYRAEPSKKTRWAYYMQAIEPTSEALNEAFPDYHPQWVQMSQMRPISPGLFSSFRQGLGMTREQCAAYLRIDERTLRRWECGKGPIPFVCFELLRVIQESVSFKMSHPEWDGWFISRNGVLVSPDLGARQGEFTPERLNWLSINSSEAALLRNEVKQLKEELGTAIAENTTLRQMFLNNGVIDELTSMQDKINNLMDSIGTAHVIPFPITGSEQLKEKAA